MPHGDRLTGLDNSFLQLERQGAHMHVGGCAIFDGPVPDYGRLVETVGARLHLVPRYRQRLASVPFSPRHRGPLSPYQCTACAGGSRAARPATGVTAAGRDPSAIGNLSHF